MAFEAGANIGIADDPMGEPQERRVNPVTFSQLVEMQRHWMTHASRRSPSGPPAAFRFGIHAFAGPDIASRFRDDEQNQSFLKRMEKAPAQIVQEALEAVRSILE